MKAKGLKASQLDRALGVSPGRVRAILRHRRGITPDTAIRLGACFGNEPMFWVSMQGRYDLWLVERQRGEVIRAQVRRNMEEPSPPA